MLRVLGRRFAYYRLIYNIVSVLTLAPIVLFIHHAEQVPLITLSGVWKIVSWMGLAGAFGLLFAGTRVFDNGVFFGFTQIAAHRAGRTDLKAQFSTRGILNHIRHPYYTAGILAAITFGDLTDLTLAVKAVLIAYLIVGAMLEEKKLLAEFGDNYREYQERVPMFVPRLIGSRRQGA